MLDNPLLGSYRRYRQREPNPMDQLAWVFELFPRLRDRQSQLAATLSGGERQMLAIGRALMAKPRLLMLDEPSLGLAPLIVKEIFRIIAQPRATGASILLVEQNARAALQVADRAYVLEMGEVTLEGPVAQLANDPGGGKPTWASIAPSSKGAGINWDRSTRNNRFLVASPNDYNQGPGHAELQHLNAQVDEAVAVSAPSCLVSGHLLCRWGAAHILQDKGRATCLLEARFPQNDFTQQTCPTWPNKFAKHWPCFSRNGTEPALIGGLAVVAHQVVRATKDVDFLVEAEAADKVHGALLIWATKCLYRKENAANYVRGAEGLGFALCTSPLARRRWRRRQSEIPPWAACASSASRADRFQTSSYVNDATRTRDLDDIRAP